MKILKIALIIVGVLLLFLVYTLIRVATKTVKEGKNRTPVVQTQQQA